LGFLFGLGQPFQERIWFGEFIPALTFKPGAIPTLVSGSILIATGLIGILVMRLIGGPDASRPNANEPDS
jgi:hypothetical protein